jgi:Zn-dependent protease with chaperone function/tetratricopeptide (TPR) repeat protein
MSSPAPNPATERPLKPAARFFLVCFASAVMLACYGFAVSALALISMLLAFEVLVVLVAARFGLIGFAAAILERHLALAAVFLRCVRLQRGPDFGFALAREEATRLFEIVESLCGKLGIRPPSVIWVQNGVNAHVELKGIHRVAGRTVLGIGYDLLAGLTEKEMEAVLGHEMAHSKLVQRGLSNFLMKGLRRLVLLSQGLSRYVNGYRRAKRRALFGETFLWFTSNLTSLAARLVATYSRQDEFDADRTAAQICGAGAVRSCLLKLRPIAEICERLPWRERVAQLQASGGLSQWLLGEIASASAFRANQRTVELFNEYSTHPTLNDRLAALGEAPANEGAGAGSSALGLLAAPDAVADKLVQQIQRVAAEQERKESRELKRWARKLAVRRQLRPLQLVAIALMVLGFILLIGFVTAADFAALIILLPMIGAGYALFRFDRYKDRVPMPSPEFGALRSWKRGSNLQQQIDGTEKELRTILAAEKTTRAKTQRAIEECYSALGKCDYLRADVVARYVLRELNNKSLEALMGLSVSAAAFGDYQSSGAAFAAVQKRTGFLTPATLWAAGWTLALAGEWSQAEALLGQAILLRPNDATVLSLLALVQSRRGKLHSAIENARKACKLKPGNNEHARQLTLLLLDAGFVREAQPRLMAVQSDASYDSELALSMVRLHLILRQFDHAERWTKTVTGFGGRPDLALRLGEAYELARRVDAAEGFYRQALNGGFHPEACIGLSRIEAQKGNHFDAERYLLSAIDTSRAVGENGANAMACLPAALGGLVGLRDPVPACRAWIATVPGNAPVPAVANVPLLVYAPVKAEAEQYLEKVLGAMDRRMGSPMSPQVAWREAPRDYQPAGPVRPGVQCIL